MTARPRVLLIDDEADILDYFERVLRRRYDVVRCSEPTQAVEMASNGQFDVVITDQSMPGMTGVEILEALKIAGFDPIKMLVSGFADEPAVRRALMAGSIDHHIIKPVDSGALLDVVAGALERRRNRADVDD